LSRFPNAIYLTSNSELSFKCHTEEEVTSFLSTKEPCSEVGTCYFDFKLNLLYFVLYQSLPFNLHPVLFFLLFVENVFCSWEGHDPDQHHPSWLEMLYSKSISMYMSLPWDGTMLLVGVFHSV